MKILIIDNNIDPKYWGSRELCRLARVAQNATIQVRRGPHDDLPDNPKGFDRIIVSGSKTAALEDAPWITKLLDFINKAVDQNIPYLGVCYGHQMLIRALAGKQAVRKADRSEFGWTKIEVIRSSPLTQNLPQSFYTFSAHYDEVCELPKGIKLLAKSEFCAIQACQLEGLPIFGIQFHPEKTAADAKTAFKEMREKPDPPPLLNPLRSEELYNPQLGEMMFQNFFQI